MKKIILLLPLLMTNTILSSEYIIKIQKESAGASNSSENPIIVEKYREWEDSTSTFTEWLNQGVPYDFGIYLPEISNQTEDFAQSQSYKQDQIMYEQKRKYDSVEKEYEDIGDPIETNQTLNLTNTRNVEVIAGEWVDNGSLINCDTWTPDTSTKVYGEEFTQSRQCEQLKDRTIDYYINSNLEESKLFSQNSLVVSEQQAFGSNDSTGWITHTSLFTGWINDGSPYEYGTYSPAISNQGSNFVQTIPYKQDQIQDEQAREINTFTSSVRNSGSPFEISQTVNLSEDRTINVTATGWTTTSGYYSCGSYSPSRSSVNLGDYFYQYRSCNQDIQRTYTYKYEGSTLHTRVATSIQYPQQSRRTTGTQDNSISATYGCPSGWNSSSNSNRCYTSVVPYNNGCPSGYIQTNAGHQCANYIPMSYSCPSGYSLSGSRCYP